MEHGHTLQFSIVSFISCETGEIWDFEIMTKHCSKCKLHKSRRSVEDLDEWFQKHKISKQRQMNYEGSSGCMEELLFSFFSSVQFKS